MTDMETDSDVKPDPPARVSVGFKLNFPDPEDFDLLFANQLVATRDPTSDMVQLYFCQYSVPHIQDPEEGQIVDIKGRHVARIAMPLSKFRNFVRSLDETRHVFFDPQEHGEFSTEEELLGAITESEEVP